VDAELPGCHQGIQVWDIQCQHGVVFSCDVVHLGILEQLEHPPHVDAVYQVWIIYIDDARVGGKRVPGQVSSSGRRSLEELLLWRNFLSLLLLRLRYVEQDIYMGELGRTQGGHYRVCYVAWSGEEEAQTWRGVAEAGHVCTERRRL